MGNDNSINCRTLAAVLWLALAGCASSGPDPVPEPAPAPEPEPAPAAPAPVLETSGIEGVQRGEPVALREDAPLRYVVRKGDTLWSISNRFLKDSWQWPELWYVNPKVRNPHLIYPGDELYLYFRGGRPQLARVGDEPPPEADAGPPVPPAGVDDLAPRVRELPLEQAIHSIPLDAIRAFLRGPRLVDEDALDDAPYLVDFEDEHLMAGNDSIAYALELENPDITQYQVVRRGQPYRDPDDNDIIGYEVLPVADSEVRVFGDPATIYLSRSDMEARAGDYLLPLETEPLAMRFVPHAPASDVAGRVISVYNGMSQIGQYQVVALNRGTDHGMEPGHVLDIWQSGRKARDPYSFFGSKVQLPDVKAGTAMVFKTDTRLSYALVMSATRAIHILDRVERPEAGR
jgi:hypothetical protein